jgi:hypothetical protein
MVWDHHVIVFSLAYGLTVYGLRSYRDTKSDWTLRCSSLWVCEYCRDGHVIFNVEHETSYSPAVMPLSRVRAAKYVSSSSHNFCRSTQRIHILFTTVHR